MSIMPTAAAIGFDREATKELLSLFLDDDELIRLPELNHDKFSYAEVRRLVLDMNANPNGEVNEEMQDDDDDSSFTGKSVLEVMARNIDNIKSDRELRDLRRSFQFIMSQRDIQYNTGVDGERETLIHFAAMVSASSYFLRVLLREIISHPVNTRSQIDYVDDEGETALSKVCRVEEFPIENVAYLLDAGASLNIMDQDTGYSSLQYAAKYAEFNLDRSASIVLMLLLHDSHKRKNKIGHYIRVLNLNTYSKEEGLNTMGSVLALPVFQGAKKQQRLPTLLLIICLLLDHGIDPNYAQICRNMSFTALQMAIQNIKDVDESALYIVVWRLLKAGADPNARDHEGNTALHYAVKYIDAKPHLLATILILLLDFGANKVFENNKGKTALMMMLESSSSLPICKDISNILLETNEDLMEQGKQAICRCDPGLQNAFTALFMLSGKEGGVYSAICKFKERGANGNNNNLMNISFYMRFDMWKRRNIEGQKIMMINSPDDITGKYLLHFVIDDVMDCETENRDTSLSAALMTLLVNSANPNIPDSMGNNAMLHVLELLPTKPFDTIFSTYLFLKSNADPNMLNHRGMPFLHELLYSNLIMCRPSMLTPFLILLLESGADPNLLNILSCYNNNHGGGGIKRREPALNIICSRGQIHDQIDFSILNVMLLLNYGADPNIHTIIVNSCCEQREEKMALHLAIESRKGISIYSLLLEAGTNCMQVDGATHETPLDIAQRLNDEDAMELIQEWFAQHGSCVRRQAFALGLNDRIGQDSAPFQRLNPDIIELVCKYV